MRENKIDDDFPTLSNRIRREYEKIAFAKDENSTNRLKALYLLEKHLKQRKEKTPSLIEIIK